MSLPTRALIRTHHITSRKKIAKLKQAASANNVFVLIRTGGSPGMMFVEGESDGVSTWIEIVHKLRYKDFHLAARPAPTTLIAYEPAHLGSLTETDTLKGFAEAMQHRGAYDWWRSAMGYIKGQPP